MQWKVLGIGLLLAGGTIVACDASCIDQTCDPELLLRLSTGNADFAEGEVRIRLSIDDESFECTTTLPGAAEEITDCGPAQVSYNRAQECVFLQENGGVRCTLSGALQQTIALLDDPPGELSLHLELDGGVEFDEDLEPEYEQADPDRVDCSVCPRTVVELTVAE